MFIEAADRPIVSTRHRELLIRAGVVQSCAFIKCKHDVGTELMLDLHRNFGGKAVHRTIEVALKCDTLIIDMGQTLFILRNYLI